ncbi:histone H2A-like [Chironomus tepperi]|uniref:histone H2A-like n=1 Tax=Chironomus tepperi TaxID=113505 RepID=UPI00391F5281
MASQKQPIIPRVIVQTNDENTSSDSSSDNEYYEPTAPTINQTNLNTRKTKRKWKDAGLLLPPNIFHKKLISGKYAKKVAKEAAVAMAGVLEYLVSEVLEISKECADINQKKRIQPRHIMLAIKSDQDFNELLKDVTFPSTGVVPFIQDCLLPSRSPSPMLGKRTSEQ